MPAMISTLEHSFSRVKDHLCREGMSIQDCLLSGFAMFSLKYPALMQFDQDSRFEETKIHNLKKLYHLNEVPSDTYMRKRLDKVNPRELRKSFKPILARVQHAGMLKLYEYYQECYLVPLDGTGCFYSKEIHCEDCCVKQHKDGTKSYYHQTLSAVIVHPDFKPVLPLCPEPILKQDGANKNDCERNAAKRLIEDLRREHPHLKIIIVEDSLASNAPHIKHLQAHEMHFILGAKPTDHQWMFDWVSAAKPKEYVMTREDKRHRFIYMNQVPLNASSDLLVNFLDYCEEDLKTGKVQHFTWVTDFVLTKENVYQLMRGGRARWKIENETFNTLKNQGYHFEHNFGHGYQHLNTVFEYLMFLAFLVDQVQQLCCPLFQKALSRLFTKTRLWDCWRGYFFHFLFENWDEFLRGIAEGLKGPRPIFINSS